DGMTAATVNGAEITVDLSDGVKINGANVTAADLKAQNGVVHVIDAVLLP
ncbi:MAG: fasciclin domain-containing protein, partial [Acidimicrobiales bacterium]